MSNKGKRVRKTSSKEPSKETKKDTPSTKAATSPPKKDTKETSKKESKPKRKKQIPLKDRYDHHIDELMDSMNKTHKDELHTELLNQIPFTDSYTNSISIAVGKQRSGKTRKILKEIIKISKMHKETHMLVYCNKTGGHTDKTFESFAKLIKCPIIYVAQDDIEQKLMDIIDYKNKYNKFKKMGLDKLYEDQTEGYQGGEFSAGMYDVDPGPQLTPQQQSDIQEVFSELHINNFNRDYLHTLVLLDDIANSPLLKKPTSYLNSLMTQCAHINMSFFLAVQYWIGLPTSIKSQCAVIYMFGGFSKQQVRYMLQQISLEDPFEVIWDQYRQCKNKDFYVVDAIAGTYKLVPSNAKEARMGYKKEVLEKAHKQINGHDDSDDEEEEDIPDPIESDSELEALLADEPEPPKAQYVSKRNTKGMVQSQPQGSNQKQIVVQPPPIVVDLNPIEPLEPIESDWEAIWNRNKEGGWRNPGNGW